MLLLFLPLLLNPMGLLAKWMPLIYLCSWPLIMENQGRDTLTLHALLLILFIMTCDLARQLMLNLIGFDLMSLPAGIGVLLLALATDKGSLVLGIVQPLFSGLMALSEPAFLVIEVCLLTDLVKSFNRWLANKANERDSEKSSLAHWEEPLSRKAIITRTVVILLTLACYIGAYLLIRESRILIEAGLESLPINFTHAIAVLTSLQLISLSLTIYKDDGVISETAMISLLATLPILLAAWSYSNLKSQSLEIPTKSPSQSGILFGDYDDYSSTSSSDSWSSWAAYIPFSTLSGSTSGSDKYSATHPVKLSPFSILWSAFQRAISQWTAGRGGGQSSGLFTHNSHQGPSLDTDLYGLLLHKLAHYFSGPDFWAVLICRLLCLAWWCSSSGATVSAGSGNETRATSYVGLSMASTVRRRWPLSRAATIKILLVLTYAQMLTQQMDNRHQLELWQSEASLFSGASLFSYEEPARPPTPEVGESWLSCMWSSARACLGGQATGSEGPTSKPHGTNLQNLFIGASQQLAHLGHLLLGMLAQLPALLASLGPIWFARWRSVIIQRLLQSGLVQLAYIGSLLLSTSD